jgi:hypothetical protein
LPSLEIDEIALMKQRHRQQKVILDMSGDKKVTPDMFPAVGAEPVGILRLIDELPDPLSSSLN